MRVTEGEFDGGAGVGFDDVLLEDGCERDGGLGIPEDELDDLRAIRGEVGEIDFLS